MKTGAAIALAIGLPLTAGVIAWAFLANKIVDKVPTRPTGGGGGGSGGGGGGGGSGDDCGTLTANDPGVRDRAMQAMQDISTGDTPFGPRPGDPDGRQDFQIDSAEFVGWLFSRLWPTCSFGPSTTATLVNDRGMRMEWSDIYRRLVGRSLATGAVDEVFAVWMPGREASGEPGLAGMASRVIGAIA